MSDKAARFERRVKARREAADRMLPRVHPGLTISGPLHEGDPPYRWKVVRAWFRKDGSVKAHLKTTTEGVGGSALHIEATVVFPDGAIRPPFRLESKDA